MERLRATFKVHEFLKVIIANIYRLGVHLQSVSFFFSTENMSPCPKKTPLQFFLFVLFLIFFYAISFDQFIKFFSFSLEISRKNINLILKQQSFCFEKAIGLKFATRYLIICLTTPRLWQCLGEKCLSLYYGKNNLIRTICVLVHDSDSP